MDLDLTKPGLRIEQVTLDDGSTVTIREISTDMLTEIIAKQDQASNGTADAELCLLMVSACVVNKDGEAYLDNDEGRKTLRSTQPWSRILEIGSKCLALNNFGSEEEEQKKSS